MIENQKKTRKYENQRNFYINLHIKHGFGMKFTSSSSSSSEFTMAPPSRCSVAPYSITML